MVVTIFLAKIIGLFFTLVCLAMLFNQKRFDKIVKEVMDRPALLALTGMLSLLFGLLIVLFHNVWEKDWRVTVTLIGWVMLIIGLLRLYIPESLVSWGKKFVSNRGHVWAIWIGLIIGLFFLYSAFYAVQM